MKTVKIQNCSYEEFEKIRDTIYEKAPFFLAKEGYSKRTSIAIFKFEDSSYISKCLDAFVMRIPGNEKLVKEIGHILRLVPCIKKLNPI